MKHLLTLFWLVVAVSISAQSAAGPPAQTTPQVAAPTQQGPHVTGRAVDQKGAPVAYATVIAARPETPNNTLKAAVTNPKGDFTLPLPAGRYILQTSFLGYDTATDTVKSWPQRAST